MSTILFIDGENFTNKLKEVLRDNKVDDPEWQKYNFRGLLDQVLQEIKIDRRIFYFAKLIEHKDTLKKSRELIQRRRLLKNHLESSGQGFEVIISGRVRGHNEQVGRKKILVFREKGIDVRIAVDMVSWACDGDLDTAILGSSDSDLQPAVKEVRKRDKEVVYLGFENAPNKGLTFTTNRTILIRNSEISKFYPDTLL